MSLLEIRNLKVKVDNHEILKGIDLEIDPGDVPSIMGPNGSGKSTLAQVLARRESYDVTSGVFFFNDTATTEIYTLSLHDALPISSSPVARTAGPSSSTFESISRRP